MVVVQKQRNFGPESATSSGIANKVRRGDIRHAVVVRAAKQMQRPDGSILKFDDNACVLINKSGDPIGTRMNGQYSSTGLPTIILMQCRCRGYGITRKAMVEDPVVGAPACVTYTNEKRVVFNLCPLYVPIESEI